MSDHNQDNDQDQFQDCKNYQSQTEIIDMVGHMDKFKKSLDDHMTEEMVHHSNTLKDLYWIKLIGKWIVGALFGYMIAIGMFMDKAADHHKANYEITKKEVQHNKESLIGVRKDLGYLVKQFGGTPANGHNKK